MPSPQADELIGAYDTAVGVTWSAAMDLDHPALAINSPSSMLTVARSAAHLRRRASWQVRDDSVIADG